MPRQRSAITGKYVSEEFAEENPDTTVEERDASQSRPLQAKEARRGKVRQRKAKKSDVGKRSRSGKEVGTQPKDNQGELAGDE